MENAEKKWPLYVAVKNSIKEKIFSGEYKPGDPLPTEKALCETFNVSRVTVRKAINELIDEEYLDHNFGKSAVVKSDSVHRNINRLSGLHEELQASGVLCSSYILSNAVVKLDEELAPRMGLNPGDKAINLSRIRYADGKPLCYQKAYLNYALCPGLEERNMNSCSLYDVLEKEYGLKLSYATQSISACMSSHRVAALLESGEAPILRIDRTTYVESGACIEYSSAYYLGNNYRLLMTLRR